MNIRLATCAISLLLFVVITSSVRAHAQSSQDSLLNAISELDRQYQAVTDKALRQQTAHWQGETFASIEQLADSLVAFDDTATFYSRLQLIYAHRSLIQRQIEHPRVYDLVDYLLHYNARTLADELLAETERLNDRHQLALVQLGFARYHAQRHDWNACLAMLGDDSLARLGEHQAHEGILLKASALQNLQRHREAIDFYRQLPATSSFYPHAQLNLAIASIRQGWLGEAHSIVDSMSNHNGNLADHDALSNRLYLVMGYAFLQQEYYRDARESFRRIDRDSAYLNRALLGIGLSASSQSDYAGGLNALALLKQRRPQDLPVAEAYLVTPFLYEKMQDEKIISASYSEAMDYYQSSLAALDRLSAEIPPIDDIELSSPDDSLEIGSFIFDYGTKYPKYFLSNYRQLAAIANLHSSDEIERLLRQHREMLDRVMQKLLAERRQHLLSYLNQSRYGLARLYDKATPAETN